MMANRACGAAFDINLEVNGKAHCAPEARTTAIRSRIRASRTPREPDVRASKP